MKTMKKQQDLQRKFITQNDSTMHYEVDKSNFTPIV